jgi:hypothetical protein
MVDIDDLDGWETDAIVPVDAAIGIIPPWLEAALSAEAAGCPLHARSSHRCDSSNSGATCSVSPSARNVQKKGLWLQ